MILDKNDIVLQFSLDSTSFIPKEIIGREEESKMFNPKKSQSNQNEKYIDCNFCDVTMLPEGLGKAGYNIKTAYWWQYITFKPGIGDFVVVRFVFSRRFVVTDFNTSKSYLQGLNSLINTGCWKVRAFKNFGQIKINFRAYSFIQKAEQYLYVMNGAVHIEAAQ